jgi:hypothetical protein
MQIFLRHAGAKRQEWSRKMAKKSFPQPQDVSFVLLDKSSERAVPIDAIPASQWRALRNEILMRVSQSICRQYLIEQEIKGEK